MNDSVRETIRTLEAYHREQASSNALNADARIIHKAKADAIAACLALASDLDRALGAAPPSDESPASSVVASAGTGGESWCGPSTTTDDKPKTTPTGESPMYHSTKIEQRVLHKALMASVEVVDKPVAAGGADEKKHPEGCLCFNCWHPEVAARQKLLDKLAPEPVGEREEAARWHTERADWSWRDGDAAAAEGAESEDVQAFYRDAKYHRLAASALRSSPKGAGGEDYDALCRAVAASRELEAMATKYITLKHDPRLKFARPEISEEMVEYASPAMLSAGLDALRAIHEQKREPKDYDAQYVWAKMRAALKDALRKEE